MKALAVAAGIVFWTLVLGIAWLAFFPGSESGGPVAVLQIEPTTAPGAGSTSGASAARPSEASQQQSAGENTSPTTEAQPASPGTQASGPNMDLPPGFGVAGAPPQPQPSGEHGSGQDTMAPTPLAAP